MNSALPTLEALRGADVTPLALLHPDLEDSASRVVEGVVTITWPYSSISRSTAFILAEGDYSLRRNGGQVRLEFRAAAGKALADAAVGGGDELRLSLEGAQWRKVEPSMRLPQGALEWQLLFESRLLLSLRRAQDQSLDVIHVNVSPEADAQPEQNGALGDGLAVEGRPAQDDVALDPPGSTVAAPPVPLSFPVKRQASSELEADEFASPAFIKRARMSYGALLEDGLGMFVDGKEKKKAKEKKKSRFSMQGASWKYTSRSPSPAGEAQSKHDTDDSGPAVDEEAQPATDLTETSPKPSMVDGASQTQELYFSPSHTDFHSSVKPGPMTQTTAASTFRPSHFGRTNDSSHTPSRTLFDRTANNQPMASSTIQATATAFGSHHLSFAAEAHTGSSNISRTSPVSALSAAALAGGIAASHYPLNPLSAPTAHIDPSLQFSGDVSAAENPYYAPGDFEWQADHLVTGNSITSNQSGAQDGAFTVAGSFGAGRRSTGLASTSNASDRSVSVSKYTSRWDVRHSSDGRAGETDTLSQKNAPYGLRQPAHVPNKEFDSSRAGADDERHSEERSQPDDDVDREKFPATGRVEHSGRNRSVSYSSYDSSNAGGEARHGIQGAYHGEYEGGFEHEYNGHYDEGEAEDYSDDEPASSPTRPREPVVIDLLSDSDEDEGKADTEAQGEPAGRGPQRSEDAAVDEEMSDRYDAKSDQDETQGRSEAGFEDNESMERDDVGSEEEMEAAFRQDQASDNLALGAEEHDSWTRSGAAQSRASERSEADLGGEEGGFARPASQKPDASSEEDEEVATYAKSHAAMSSDAIIEDLEQTTEERRRGEAGLESETVPRQLANNSYAEMASSEQRHEQASEEGSPHDEPVMKSQHESSGNPGARDGATDDEEKPLADEATDSGPQEAMDMDEAPREGIPELSKNEAGLAAEHDGDEDELMTEPGDENKFDTEVEGDAASELSVDRPMTAAQVAENRWEDEFQDAATSPRDDWERRRDTEARDEQPSRPGLKSKGEQSDEAGSSSRQPGEGFKDDEKKTKYEECQSDVEEDVAETNPKSSRDDESTKKSGGKELEVHIPVKALRSRGHSRTMSRELDPSLALAQTKSAKLPGRGSGKESRGEKLRASGSQRSDEPDPSLALAKAAVSSTVKTRTDPKTSSAARGKRRAATPDTTTTARGLRSSGRVNSPVESVMASPSGGGSTDEEAAEAKRKLLTTLRTQLPEAEALRSLRSQLNRTVDVIAVSTMTPAQPHRPKQGPRDYMLELVLTDASTAPGRVTVAQLFRPHVESLPVVQAGDVVLLRRVQVMSLQGRGFGVRAGEQSAWAVFERDDEEMLAQIKGPPVEVTEGEVEYARGLKGWWTLVMRDERAVARVDRATSKVSRAKDR
ncbi:Telomere end binding protein [Ophiocordyceps camponoti-floridani]|uniref:Telomere end binding protein n=1 Tax=Ophiocordyceps camponoti-floridani TaxID=2030778 RepID=A0A8H4Q538_9HYPO|nr:Telomere end binding protein [Ophiocordyceps camponoti-floridani]